MVGRFLSVVVPVVLTTAAAADTARAFADWEGRRVNSILLNGDWEFSPGDGSEQAESPEGTSRLHWQAVKLPGPFMAWSQEAANQTKVIWARRTFKVTPAQAQGLAVLRWNRIACGATAFINGQQVGANEPTGPFQVIVPARILKSGDNQIVLKIRGAAGVPRSRSGNALIPAGFGVGMPEVTDDVWLDFADAAYLKWVLALPDLAGSRVKIRVTPTGPDRLEDLQIVAQVKSWPDGRIMGEGRASARLTPGTDPFGGEHFFVEVPMPGFQPWTYETPNLYTAQVTLRRGEKMLDAVTIRFGMREITIAGGHYLLNGKTLRLRGSELCFEWDWGDTITGNEFDYLVTEAREMSMNAFRTHTRPLPPLWANICDENGTMILAEFPCLYNYQDYKFTPQEYALWHQNVLSDAAGWMARLWNHPAVVMWVLSNESNRDGEWEKGPYHDFVRALDPTRPTMRTGDTGTAENYDVHTCGNIEDTLEGNLIPGIGSWFRAAKGRPVTNSEYMNYFGRPATQWTGKEDKEADALACAQIGMEHTEAMRRARLDGMLPYMYAGWTRTRLAARVKETGKGSAVWKAGYASPLSACWHSALSPVLASLDLFDANYRIGQQVQTDLYLINDSWHDAAIHVDLLVTEECPELIPEAACFDRPVAKWSYDFMLKADTLTKTPVTWRLPEREGNYWLTARTTGISGRPVLSQRFVRTVRPPEVPATLRERRFVVLGGDAAADAWFSSWGLQTDHGFAGAGTPNAMDRVGEPLTPGKQVVVIWNAAHLTADEKRQAGVLREFVSRGGRVVVLATRSWDWTELCDMKVGDTRGSRVFPYPDGKSSILAGVQPEWLMRWNGLPGTVAVGSLDGPALAAAEKVLWVREPKIGVAADVPVAEGTGRILFSQLDVQRHVDRSKPGYDPVAEQILINLLRGTQRQEDQGKEKNACTDHSPPDSCGPVCRFSPCPQRRCASGVVVLTGSAVGAVATKAVLEGDSVRVEADLAEGRLRERYSARTDDGAWVEVATSAGVSGGPICLRAVRSSSQGNVPQEIEVVATELSASASEMTETFSAGPYRIVRKISPAGSASWLRVTTRLEPAQTVELQSIADRFAFSQRAEWSYSPSVGGFNPDAQYKAPLILVQSQRVALGIVPDVTALQRDTLRLCPHALDLDVTASPSLRVGFMPAKLAHHSVYRMDAEGPPTQNGALGTPVRVWKLEKPLENTYFLLLTATAEAGQAYRQGVRFHWERFGRPCQSVAAEQQKGTGPYQDLGLFDQWRQRVWEEESRKAWLRIDLPDGSIGGGVSTSRALGPRSVYLSSWFNSLRTAFGMALYARRTGRDDLLQLASRTVELALKSPGVNGAFKCIAALDKDNKLVWGAGDGSGSSTIQGYLGYDMSWTAYWLLRWREAQLPGHERVLLRCQGLARFLIARQQPDGMFVTFLDEAGYPLQDKLPYALAETGPVALFLLKLYETDKQPEYLEAAQRGLVFLEKEVIPQRKWYDFETFWSCSPRGISFDTRTGQWPANDLALGQAVAAFLQAWRVTGNRAYLEKGESLLDYLLLYQQCWTNPLLNGLTGPAMLLGGFTTQNSDAEWSDARQSQCGNILLEYYRATGTAEYLERGIAALRAQFPISPSENWAHGGYGGKAGVSSFHWGSGSGMAGIEIDEEFLRDAIVDVASGASVGINGLNVTKCEIGDGKIAMEINSPFQWRREPVMVFRNLRSSGSCALIVNGATVGTYQAAELEKGIAVPLKGGRR